ncbi:MAG: succinylglutamate desuccinylase/aspartoacylase family protein [Verrucomicrobiales bacterium]|nr:succinylglutamate desuccinylase/aspartoacylase family protein [Verrucomicrobiales bacterium]
MKRISFLLVFSLLIHVSGARDAVPPEEASPAISYRSGKIAEGTDWETEFFIADSGKSGSTVLIVGGMHGNEPAGSRAADQIRHWPIVSGKLIVIPRANVLALEANKRMSPGQPEEAGNLNRNFPSIEPGDGSEVKPRGELAAALWRFAFKMKPDWVIDLHEGFEFHGSHTPPEGRKKSVGSSVIYLGGEKMDPLIEKVIAAADTTINDPAKRFSRISSGPVTTGLARACINVMGAEALILETTYKGQPLSLRTRQHRVMANILLNHIGLVGSDCANRIAAPKRAGRLQVALFDGAGTSSSTLMNVIDAAADLSLSPVGPEEMQPEVLEQFDVVIFPGGSGSKQANAIAEKGRAAVTNFIDSGGGVVGVCAGAYLCSANYSWSLKVVDSRVFTGSVEIPGKGRKQLWYRGPETGIDLELTPKGQALFGSKGIPKAFEVRYANGPIITPHGSETLEEYEVLAWFRSETGLWEPQKGTMIHTPAIVSAKFGKGRVVSVSPHPEKTPALRPIIHQVVRWSAGAE